jgi:hypothetical protein
LYPERDSSSSSHHRASSERVNTLMEERYVVDEREVRFSFFFLFFPIYSLGLFIFSFDIRLTF